MIYTVKTQRSREKNKKKGEKKKNMFEEFKTDRGYKLVVEQEESDGFIKISIAPEQNPFSGKASCWTGQKKLFMES